MQTSPAVKPNGSKSAAASPAVPAAASPADSRSEAYYHFALGRYFDQQYEATSQSEAATAAIEHYKKAYQLDPSTELLAERLVEMYSKSYRIRDAVLGAQEILKRDPDNLPMRRLLARIYLRTLGELNSGAAQKETAGLAIEQLREIRRIRPEDAEASLMLARLFRLQNDVAAAENVLRELLARLPGNEEATGLLAQILGDAGRAREALDLLEPLALSGERRPASGKLLGLLGSLYAQSGAHAKSENAFRRASELEPAVAAHARGRARALLAMQEYEAALEQYVRLTAMEPEEIENYLRAAQLYRHLKKLDLAEASLRQAQARAPGNLEVVYQSALLAEAQGKFDQAIRVISGAVAGLKSRPGPEGSGRRPLGVLYEQLVRLYREESDFPAALLTAQELLALGGEHARRARTLLVDTYRAARRIEDALAESQKLLDEFPEDRSARRGHALLLGEAGHTDEAARMLRGQVTGAPADRETLVLLAQVFERGRRFTEAEKSARAAEALAASPAENEIVWLLLGATYERQQKWDAAEAQFEKILAMNPKNAQALNYFGYMLADRGVRLDEAVALILRALEEDPYNGAYLDSLGWAYYRQGRMGEAEEYLRRAVDRSPTEPAILEHLGDLLHSQGRVALAAAEWEKALAQWRRSLPSEFEDDKVAALEKRLAGVKNRLAQRKPPADAKP